MPSITIFSLFFFSSKHPRGSKGARELKNPNGNSKKLHSEI